MKLLAGFDLKMPGYGDPVDIQDINGNFEIVSAALLRQVEALAAHDATLELAQRTLTDHAMRIAMLEDALFNDITTNAFTVRFDNLSGVNATGVYNEALQRLEC